MTLPSSALTTWIGCFKTSAVADISISPTGAVTADMWQILSSIEQKINSTRDGHVHVDCWFKLSEIMYVVKHVLSHLCPEHVSLQLLLNFKDWIQQEVVVIPDTSLEVAVVADDKASKQASSIWIGANNPLVWKSKNSLCDSSGELLCVDTETFPEVGTVSTSESEVDAGISVLRVPAGISVSGVPAGISVSGVLAGISVSGVPAGISVSGVPAGISVSGVPAGISVSGVPAGVSVSGVPAGISVSGVPAGISVSGVPAGISVSGVPAVISVSGVPAGISGTSRYLSVRGTSRYLSVRGTSRYLSVRGTSRNVRS